MVTQNIPKRAGNLLCQQQPQQRPLISEKPATWFWEIMTITDHFDPPDHTVSLVPHTK